MNFLRSLVDNVGDVFGTSQLAKLNRTVFQPVLGTEITREEYDMCDGANLFPTPSQKEVNAIKGFNDIERNQMADSILGHMVDNGTVFSDRRINSLVIGQQKVLNVERGTNPVCFKVMKQMSNKGEQHLDNALRRQYGL